MINTTVKIHLKSGGILELQESLSVENLKVINYDEAKLKDMLLKRFNVEDTSKYSININSTYRNKPLSLRECISNNTQIVIKCLS